MELGVEEGILGRQVVISMFLAIGGVDDFGDETDPIMHQLLLLALLHRLEVKLLLAGVHSEGEIIAMSSHCCIFCLEIEGFLQGLAIPDGKFEVLKLDLCSFALGSHTVTEEKQAKKPSVSV